jgi:hypothetical protein
MRRPRRAPALYGQVERLEAFETGNGLMAVMSLRSMVGGLRFPLGGRSGRRSTSRPGPWPCRVSLQAGGLLWVAAPRMSTAQSRTPPIAGPGTG